MKKYRILALLITVVVLANCGKSPVAPDYQKEISVFGYLWANNHLDATHAITVTYTQPVTEYYDANQSAITMAKVSLTDESSGQIFILRNTPQKPGYFYNDSVFIKVKTTYRLQVEADGRIVTAITTVPMPLDMTTTLKRDSINLVYKNNLGFEQPIFLQCESGDQVVMVDAFCNEDYQNAEYIKSFGGENKHPRNQEEYDGGRNSEPRHILAYARYDDLVSSDFSGEHVIYWYDAMFVFYGSYTLQVLAIDDNYHKFLYSEHPEVSGGIQGGIGVFGSVAGVRFQFIIQK